MSMHKIPLTPIEEAGLRAHGLDIGAPSQLSDAFRQGVRFASAQLPSQGGEAVAWHTEDHLTDKSATTYDSETAERWRTKGWPVTPLYTHPADQVADDLTMVKVPRELANIAALHLENSGYTETGKKLRALLNGGRS